MAAVPHPTGAARQPETPCPHQTAYSHKHSAPKKSASPQKQKIVLYQIDKKQKNTPIKMNPGFLHPDQRENHAKNTVSAEKTAIPASQTTNQKGKRYPYSDSNHYPKSPQDRKNILLPCTNTNKSAPQKKAAHLFFRTSMAHAPNPIPHHSAMHPNFPKPHQAHSDRKQIKIIIKNKGDIEK